MANQLDPETLEKAFALKNFLEARLTFFQDKELAETSLKAFVEQSWKWMDSAEYETCWAIDALCEHLEAVTKGDISRLLINFPPRCAKSNVASIAWPAWTWCQPEKTLTAGPGVKFLCSSYAHSLGLKLATKSRRLVESPWYQERWPLKFRSDQNTKSDYENDQGGARQATSVKGSLLGIGGDIIVIDDPHDTEQVESDIQRQAALDHFSELSTTRLNNPKKSPIVVIMQRLHERDVSGEILMSEDSGDWTHLMLPMHYDRTRHCSTVLKYSETGIPLATFDDPRLEQNELLWPSRFPDSILDRMARKLGPYMSSGRLEQMPSPAGGAILLEEWWQEWDAATFPLCEYVLCSVDPAYTEKHENDPTGITVWGVFRDGANNPKTIVLYAFQCRAMLNDLVRIINTLCTTQKLNYEKEQEILAIMNKVKPDRTPDIIYLPRFPVNRILVELKASGHSVVQELARLFKGGNFIVEGFNPSEYGDKVARANSVVPMLSDNMVYAPIVKMPNGARLWRSYANMLIDQCSMFPMGEHDDLVDSTTQALLYMRTSGALAMREEQQVADHDALLFRGRERPLYDV